MKTPNVKINLELGRALRDRLERDASQSCRKLSWQVLYYLNRALAHPVLTVKPDETLDDIGGRFTAYVPEEMFNRLVGLADAEGSNLSAVVRAAVLQGMNIEAGGK